MTSLLYLFEQDILSCKGEEHLAAILPDIRLRLKEDGYCIVKMWDLTAAPLIALRASLGCGQLHVRADYSGVVTIAPNAPHNIQLDETHYYGGSSRKHPPHSDGAYLNGILLTDKTIKRVGPPAIVLLQCVRATPNGGANILIDAQPILQDLVTRHPNIAKVLMSHGCVSFCRDDHMAIDLPIYERLSADRWRIRFRCDETLYFPESTASAVQHFYKHYITKDKYQQQIKLEEGQILLVDNFRVLHGRESFSSSAEHNRFFRRTWVQDDSPAQILYNFCDSSRNCPALERHTAYGSVAEASVQPRHLHLDLGVRLPHHLQAVIEQPSPQFLSTAA
jgi:alpha-ketoglutarate-dependent taurine dioxygenase